MEQDEQRKERYEYDEHEIPELYLAGGFNKTLILGQLAGEPRARDALDFPIDIPVDSLHLVEKAGVLWNVHTALFLDNGIRKIEVGKHKGIHLLLLEGKRILRYPLVNRNDPVQFLWNSSSWSCMSLRYRCWKKLRSTIPCRRMVEKRIYAAENIRMIRTPMILTSIWTRKEL
jgi:hypothetical protein